MANPVSGHEYSSGSYPSNTDDHAKSCNCRLKIDDNQTEAEKGKSMSDVVVTYNILSSEFGHPEHHVGCSSKNLDPRNRIGKIISKLAAIIGNDPIICLQEVSMYFFSELNTFFQNKNYFVISDLYGYQDSGYMGCLIAFPNSKYNLGSNKIVKVGSELKKMLVEKKTGRAIMAREMLDSNENSDDLVLSACRHNSLIMVILQRKNDSGMICVGTYHMPCTHEKPIISLIHGSYIVKEIHGFASGVDYILAGDFNIKPDDLTYSLITDGVDYSFCIEPIGKYVSKHKVSLENLRMRSAYALANRKEPVYTNCRHKKGHDLFVGCLDYIFISNNLTVKSTLPLPEKYDEPIPSDDEPSDHLMLGARLCQKKLK
jgi:mRNA deadenylase 3'-5' endonuclease subunit Ccr4